MKLEEARRDQYRKKAKEEGYRSRAAFKLMQINEKYRMIRAGSVVADIGCAPGGWLQVASDLCGPHGLVVGVDIVPVKPVSGSKQNRNVKILLEDISSVDFPGKLEEALGRGRADCILADLSPKLSGIWDMDHFKQIELCHKVLDLMPSVLSAHGSSVMKAFHGAELDSLVKRLRGSFARVEVSKPEASRSESSEVYLVALDFSGQVPPRSSADLPAEDLSEPQSDSVSSDSLQSDRLP